MKGLAAPIADVPPRRLLAETALVFAASWLLLFSIVSDFPLAYDEGIYLQRQRELASWFGRLFDPRTGSRRELFSAAVLDRHWRVSRELPDPHGPVAFLLSLAGHWLTAGLLPVPASYRVGGMSLFALAVATVYRTLRRRWSGGSALLTVGFLLSFPQLLPWTCLAMTEGPLVSLALLSFCAFLWGLGEQSWRTWMALGLALGLLAATKFTGTLAIAALCLWATATCQWKAVKLLVPATIIAALVVFLINPGWWPNPWAAIGRYLDANLTRAQTMRLPTLFLGQRYDFSLPWYNSLVWLVAASPVGVLLLGLVGIAGGAIRWREDPVGSLLIVHLALLLVLRMSPHAPGHDGVRLMLMSLGYLPVLAGYGFETIGQWSRHWTWPVWPSRVLLVGAALLALAESARSAVRYHPIQTSYFSPLIGGLGGADRLGFEPTYQWMALTHDVLDWLNSHTRPGEWVWFPGYNPFVDLLHEWGHLRPPPGPPSERAGPPAWIVVENRPGIVGLQEETLARWGQPVYQRTLLGVPLITVHRGRVNPQIEIRRLGTGSILIERRG